MKAMDRRYRRRRIVAAGVLVVFVAGAVAVAALAYRHFHRSTPPPLVEVKTITVTIPEGYDRSQTAELAREDGLRGSYEKATLRSPYLDPAEYGGAGAKNLEGFLFPDTFELERHAKVGDLVQRQLEDFKRRIAGVDMSYARSKNLTVFDVVTIASMIEREAGLPSQRKLVAAVIYNRLREGMPLGIDATTRFATGNYTQPLTESELAVDSPYNTRTHVGLPPGPIDSPGLASIEAAAHPAEVDYLYYVVEPGACNKLAFSSTEAEFFADVERYESAREAAGGKSPDTCGE
jgi:peptidoglycan lytic transglycosylase G